MHNLTCQLCNSTFSTKSNYNRHSNKEDLCISKRQLYELINNKDNLIEQQIEEIKWIDQEFVKVQQEDVVVVVEDVVVEELIPNQLTFSGIFEGCLQLQIYYHTLPRNKFF